MNKKILSGLLSLSVFTGMMTACNQTNPSLNDQNIDNSVNAQSNRALSLVQRNKLLSKRILVGYTGNLTTAIIKNLEKDYNITFKKDIKKVNMAVFETKTATINSRAISLLEKHPIVEFVGKDQAPVFNDNIKPVETPLARGNDPLRKSQWSLDKVKADEAWKVTKGEGTIISIVDTGVDLTHPDLVENILPGYNAEEPGKPAQDGARHGTHCAGIAAAAANDVGVIGMAPKAKILPVRAISRGGVAEVVDGIIWATDNGANVISLSLGWDFPSEAVDKAIGKALKYGLSKNVVFSCALSNSSRYNDKSVPDNYAGRKGYEGVIGVGNVTASGSKNGASGEWKTISSPGTNIISTVPGGKWAQMTGTSMATPLVAGVAALIISKNPGIKNSKVREIIKNSALDMGTPGFDKTFGYGLVNPVGALNIK